MMKSKKYYELVRRYERQARENPIKFHRRLKRKLLLGYGYIAVVVVVALVLLLVAILLAWIHPSFWMILGVLFIALIVIQMIRQLMVAFESMEGIQLTADQCPELFKEIDLLREQMDIPTISHVYLTGELNAFAGDYRTRFFFGSKHRVLAIGLPLFKMLTVDELRSVIAHEIAHLARGHSRIAAAIGHLRANWFIFLADGHFWWQWFAKYYADSFEAMASVIGREHELEADRIAFLSVGTHATVSGQLCIGLLSSVADNSHQEWIHLQVENPEPPNNVTLEFLKRLEQPLRRDQCLPLLRRIAADETSIYETHPALIDRITRAGFVPGDSLQETAEAAWNIIENRPVANAAEYFLGSKFATFREQIDLDYQNRRKLNWGDQRQARQNCENELETIETEIAGSQTIPTEFQLERRAEMLLQLQGTEAGHAAYKALLQRFPENPAALLYCGQYAYHEDVDPERAEALLLKAMDSDPRYESLISFMMIDICRELRKPEEADKWQEYGFGAADALEDSMTERSAITKKDKFLPADLTLEQVNLIVDQLKSDKRVLRIWAARKQVEYYHDKPLYVFGIEIKYCSFWIYAEEHFDKVIHELLQTTRFPDQFFLLHLHSANKVFRKKFKKLDKETACIYSR